MKFAFKLALTIFITGTIVLVLVSYAMYQFNRISVIKTQLDYTKAIANEISQDVEQLLIEKTKTALTLANTPLIKSALDESNSLFTRLTEAERKESIKRLDSDWKGIKNEKDPFISKYTDNDVSRYFREQQTTVKGEYGEIFLTNKFGALVASTAKLSTFAHGHKYWWLGAHDNGAGSVFFDDRGYDDSVAGYVLGVVVPVRNSKDIIGILKCNLNIMGAIDRLVSGATDNLIGDLKLVRSGGAIVFENGSEPLSTKVSETVHEQLKKKYNGSSVVNIAGKKWLVGFSEIKLTSTQKGYRFGGSFKSIDHKKGNTGESWYVLSFRDMETVMVPVIESIKGIVMAVVLVILILATVALLFARQVAHPLTNLTERIGKIAKGNFEVRVESKRRDEFGILAQSVNRMAEELGQTTTSIKLLEDEIGLRKKSESEKANVITELNESLNQVKTLRGLVPICANCKSIRDDKGYWQILEKYISEHSEAKFSHSICPECAKKLYPDLGLYDKENE
jgi:HAMP domain-containing protein